MVICPADRANVISKVKGDRKWVTVVAVGKESSNGCGVVDDNRNEFQDIDWDEVAIRVLRDTKLCLPNYFLGPGYMPAKFQLSIETTSAIETCAAESNGIWHPRDNVTELGLPGDA